jgi:hypothetical protein
MTVVIEQEVTQEQLEGQLSNLAVRNGMKSKLELLHRVTNGEFPGSILESKVRSILFLLGASHDYVYTMSSEDE